MGRDRGRVRNLVLQEKWENNASRARLTLDRKLEVLQLLDQGVTHNTMADSFKRGLRTVFRVQEERRPLYHPGPGSKPKHCRRLRERQPTVKACQTVPRTLLWRGWKNAQQRELMCAPGR